MSTHLDRARWLFRQVRYDLAERELLHALAAEPASAAGHALLGLCRDRLRRWAEALPSCREAVRLAPDSAFVHYALAYVLDDCGRLDEALAAIREALRLDPAAPDYHALCAFLQARAGCYRESLTAAEEGLRLAPEHVHCLNRRALALAALSRPEEAEAVIRATLAGDPENAVTLANFGWVLLEQQMPAPALEKLREALSLDPCLGWARDKAIDALVLLVEQGLDGQALKHFPDALRRDPEMKEGRQRLARTMLRRVSEVIGGCLQAFWLLGCYLTLGPNPSPRLGFLLMLLLVLYVCVFPRRFVLVEPVCCLLLRCRALGRRVLSPEQVTASTCVGAVLGAALLAVVTAWLTGAAFTLLVAVVCQSLALPIAYVFACPPQRPRSGMSAYLALLALAGTSLLALRAVGLLSAEVVTDMRDLLFLLGAGVTGLLARALLALNGEAQPRSVVSGKG
jgi:tetratricopeptide (TPR) repeat protein